MRKIYGFVYLIFNRVNGKVYIGQTRRTIAVRWRQHKERSLSGCEQSPGISNAIRKYGPESFTVAELGRAFTSEELNSMEVRAIWANESDSREYGYNIDPGGKCGPVAASTRKKMAEIAKLRQYSSTTRAKMSETRKGKKHSSETRARMSAAQIGKIVSPETRAKQSAAKRRLSAETIEKMRAAAKARMTPETREKIAESVRRFAASNGARPVSEETRLKISVANKGKAKWSEDDRAKMSKARSSGNSTAPWKHLESQKEQWVSAT